ncbi:MAG: ABC transporter ATP-binding protein [Bauldia sp.]|uniref:ABC transporter ATP-binding protein n=1 Tax=Bauldia sp. TaxID=2575872 RepID=UPI001DF1BC15|nr:ABC transporter ATP-binding protein [Bauldia sp.]MCB1497981.1 ABC transporter ATP-binding protein [Bauldia sp.]
MLNWLSRLSDPFIDAPVVRPPTGLLGFYRHFIQPVRGLLVTLVVVSLIASLSELALFVFLGKLVDLTTNSASPATFFRDNVWLLAAMGFVVLIVRPVSVLLSRGLTTVAFVPSLTALVRWRSYRYVLRQSLSFFQNDFAGRIAQKVMQSGPALRESVVNVVEGVWTLVIYLVGTIILFAGLDPWLILPVVAWACCYAVTIIRLVPPVRARSQAAAEANSGLSGRIVDSYTNIQAVKLFAHAEREDAFAKEGFVTQVDAFRRLAAAILTMMASLNVINSLLIFAVSGLALWLWSIGEISVGSIAMASALVIRLNQMSGWILRTITSLFENIGTLQNAIETISRPHAIVDKPEAKPLTVTIGEIRFENIRFHYGREDGGVIEDLSLSVAPGERVGLVGRSGAGKSTLVNLLLRLYDLEGGRILIDGQDISEVTQESLRSWIGMVTQDTALLHRSVRDNIRYGRPEASEEEIRAAAERAQAGQFVPELRDFRGRTGYDAFVGERGVKLSGGQRQRVAIARLLLKDAPILILDEATSALDSEVEAAIQEQLYSLMDGRTVIAIAHRLSTIAVLDRLVVMDEGRIVESGTHKELLERGGLYASLWKRQSGGFLGTESADGFGQAAAE